MALTQAVREKTVNRRAAVTTKFRPLQWKLLHAINIKWRENQMQAEATSYLEVKTIDYPTVHSSVQPNLFIFQYWIFNSIIYRKWKKAEMWALRVDAISPWLDSGIFINFCWKMFYSTVWLFVVWVAMDVSWLSPCVKRHCDQRCDDEFSHFLYPVSVLSTSCILPLSTVADSHGAVSSSSYQRVNHARITYSIPFKKWKLKLTSF